MKSQVEKELENARRAAQNVLEDLSIEKAKLEVARAKEEALLQSIGDGVVAVDKDGKIILINHVAEVMLGLPAKHLIGKSPGRFLIKKAIKFPRPNIRSPPLSEA